MFRAACVTHAAVGCPVAPRIRMRRLACSITAKMYIRAPASVMVSMKSAASNASACERRNCVQVVAARFGAGSIPDARRNSHTVDAATVIPSVSNSPCTRRYPHDGFSATRRSTSTRIERMVGGRPRCRGRDAAACRRAARSRCQRSTVSGRTSSRRPCRLGFGSRCSNAASHARSAGSNCTRCPSS